MEEGGREEEEPFIEAVYCCAEFLLEVADTYRASQHRY